MEGYLKWIVARRRKGFRVDGFVLTEHRSYDPTADYSEIAEKFGVVVLRGAELETDIGHVLVYGVTPRLTEEFDVTDVSLPHERLFARVRELGGYAVGAHAGRPRIGLADHVGEAGPSPVVQTIEQLNGGSSDAENDRALRLAEVYGLGRVGGSDAHYVSAIGRCLTAFNRPVTTVEALVEALVEGDHYPVRVEDTAEEGS